MNTVMNYESIFERYGGIMRTCELTREEISYQILQNLIEQGRVEKIKYGYYQWQDEKAFTEVSVITALFLTAVTLIFTQMQSYAEKIYMDELSGLYNRRYPKAVLAKRKNTDANSLYGIMMDVNDFKYINDSFGHSMGDKAISTMGNILFKSIPDAGIAIRYAEFGKDDNAEVFLRNMDDKMYEEKRRYHGAAPSIPE